MNETDLRSLLDERVTSAVGTTDPDALAATVRGRARTIRSRRAGAAVGVAALLVTAVVGVPQLGRPDAAPAPAAPVPAWERTVGGFPEYSGGFRFAVAGTLDLARGPKLVVQRPASPGEVVTSTRCSPRDLYVRIYPVARPDERMEGTCGAGWNSGISPSVAEPVVLEVLGRTSSVGDLATGPAGAVPRSGTVSVAFGVPVPVDEYPFPPRPAELPPLKPPMTQAMEPDGAIAELGGTGAGPATRSVSIRLTTDGHVMMRSQTPGRVVVEADGVEVLDGTSWDWKGSGFGGGRILTALREAGRDVSVGDEVTLTARAERVTGQWRVDVFPTDVGYG